MTTKNSKTFAALCAALLLIAGASFATDDSGEEVRKIRIKKSIHCEGDDCPEEGKHRIFIDEDGETTILNGDEFEWHGGEGHEGIMALHMSHSGGFLGVQLTELTDELRTHFGVPSGLGVMVSKVVDDSPAQKAGLQAGDIITLVDGEDIKSARLLSRAISDYEDGQTAALEVWREGKAQRLSAAIEEREGAKMSGMPRMLMRRGGHGGEAGLFGATGDHKVIMIDCDDEAGDCDIEIDPDNLDFDCGGGDECRVEVQCDDGGCSCTVNGEATDCAGIPGVPGQ